MERSLKIKLIHNKKNKSVLLQIPKLKLTDEMRTKLKDSTFAKIRVEDFE